MSGLISPSGTKGNVLLIGIGLGRVRQSKKVAHTRLPSVGYRSWSRFLAVSLQVTWVINPAVGCHYFPPGLHLPPEPLRGLLPMSLLGEQRHNGCEQFAEDCYPTASRLQFEPGPFCAWVQNANHSPTESPCRQEILVDSCVPAIDPAGASAQQQMRLAAVASYWQPRNKAQRRRRLVCQQSWVLRPTQHKCGSFLRWNGTI